MAAIGTIQRIGNVKNATREIELNTLAGRSVVRPNDYTVRGAYSVGGTAQIMSNTAPMNANTVLASFQWKPPYTALALIKKVTCSLVLTTAGTASAGVYILDMVKVRSFAFQYGGAVLAPQRLSPAAGLSTRMPYSLADFIMSGSTGAAASEGLAAPATSTTGAESFPPTLDATDIGSLSGSATLTAGRLIIPPTPIWLQEADDMPLLLSPLEGFVVRLVQMPTNTATTALQFGISASWEELETY